MSEITLSRWDSADQLKTQAGIAAYLDAVLEAGDPALARHALGVVAGARAYMMLTDRERCSAPSNPNSACARSSTTKRRARGHLFITVRAYQLVELLRRHLAAQGIHDSWARLRARLNGQVRVTASFRRPDGRALCC